MFATSRPDRALAGHLRLDPVGGGEWTASCLSGRSGRVFGGQILAQGLVAAVADLGMAGPSRPHSLHAHFLRAAQPDSQIRYRATSMRRSSRFATTRVDLVQGSSLVATLTVSSHRGDETPTHSPVAPAVHGAPEDAPPAAGGPIPPVDALIRWPFDLRAARLLVSNGDDGRPRVSWWVRLREAVPSPVENAAALAWASDFALTQVADIEHEHRAGVRQAASLDHAMWFHQETDLSRWHLYVLTSPMYRDGLALSRGELYDADGELIASVMQESLLRRVVAQDGKWNQGGHASS